MHAEPLEPRLLPTPLDIIGLPAEQAAYHLTGASYNVALLDTGLDTSAAYYRGGYDFVDGTATPSDTDGHGRFVADEIHLVAPDAGIYGLKVLGANGVGSFGDIDAALKWVESHYQQDHIVAVNLSFGGQLTSDAPVDADLAQLDADGLTIVAAAGNDQATQPNRLDYPANNPHVVSVGATYAASYGQITEGAATDFVTYPDKIAAFSQRSPQLDLLAPGAFITSSYGQTTGGTSMATPLVTGAAVLVHQALDLAHQPADESDVLAVLQHTGKPIVDAADGSDNVQHTGLTFSRLDVENAVASILGDQGTPQPAPAQPAPAQPTTPSGPTDATFVASLYRHVLHRTPEPSGLNYWVGLLASGATRLQVASGIWLSAEHEREYVAETPAQLYETLLDREGEPAGIAAFSRFSEDAGAEIMLASDEFWRNSASG